MQPACQLPTQKRKVATLAFPVELRSLEVVGGSVATGCVVYSCSGVVSGSGAEVSTTATDDVDAVESGAVATAVVVTATSVVPAVVVVDGAAVLWTTSSVVAVSVEVFRVTISVHSPHASLQCTSIYLGFL